MDALSFLVGVLATVIMEIVALFIAALVTAIKRVKSYEN